MKVNTKKYSEGHNNSGLEVGDKVIVIRRITDQEENSGWENSWTDNMDFFINKKCIIENSDEVTGFSLRLLGIQYNRLTTYEFPYFVLLKADGLTNFNIQKIEELIESFNELI